MKKHILVVVGVASILAHTIINSVSAQAPPTMGASTNFVTVTNYITVPEEITNSLIALKNAIVESVQKTDDQVEKLNKLLKQISDQQQVTQTQSIRTAEMLTSVYTNLLTYFQSKGPNEAGGHWPFWPVAVALLIPPIPIWWIFKAWRTRNYNLAQMVQRTALALIFVSLVIAFYVRWLSFDSRNQNKEKPLWAYCMLGLWAIVPPIYFIADWVVRHDKNLLDWLQEGPSAKHENAHSQAGKQRGNEKPPERDTEYYFRGYELARNFWIAFVILLAVIMRMKWPFGGD